MIRTLFELTAQPSKLGPLGLDKLLDLVAETLSRVDRPAFFEKFNQEQAVQYFYEPFLEAFDPVLRKELGVWYTPHEVVRYIVARVDTALKEELGIADGLADPRVVVLCSAKHRGKVSHGWPTRAWSSWTPAAAPGLFWWKCCGTSARR